MRRRLARMVVRSCASLCAWVGVAVGVTRLGASTDVRVPSDSAGRCILGGRLCLHPSDYVAGGSIAAARGWHDVINSRARQWLTCLLPAAAGAARMGARVNVRLIGEGRSLSEKGGDHMGLFGPRVPRRVPAGRKLGRDLGHAEHSGWRKLVLVRHGQTDYNVKHLLPGQLPGIPLNDEGRREATALAQALRDLPLTAIVASPLERTMETAGHLNAERGLEIRQDRDLLDTDYGRFSGQCWDDLDKANRAWARFTSDPLRAPRGVESFARVQERAVRAAERWRHDPEAGEWVGVVTHADLVKLIVAHYMGIPLAHVPLINMDNASATLLAFHPAADAPPSMLCFNWTSPALWLAAARRA